MSRADHYADKHIEMVNRIKNAREALMNLRNRYGMNHDEGIAYGAVGLLDYILLNDPEKIMHPNIRHEVLKVGNKEDKE